jgi:hypothetical protein
MAGYEYKVVPAPAKGQKAKGVKGPESRFAFALENVMNDMAAQGWEFQRSETLPSEERTGLTSTTTNWRNVLVFRRPRKVEAPAEAPKLLEAPVAEPHPPEQDEPVAAAATPAAAVKAASPMVFDLSDEDVTELDSLGQVVRNRAAVIRSMEGGIEDAEEVTEDDAKPETKAGSVAAE